MVVIGTLALGFIYFPSLLLLILNTICCGLDLVKSKLTSHLLCFVLFFLYLISLISLINE